MKTGRSWDGFGSGADGLVCAASKRTLRLHLWLALDMEKASFCLVSAAAFGLAVASGLLAWTQRNFQHRLAVSGAVISALFSIVIIAQAIPNLMLGGCE